MYLQRVPTLVKQLERISLSHKPRSENAQVDSLAKLASSADGRKARNITWEILPFPSINHSIAMIDRLDTWMDPFINFFQERTLPDDPAHATLFLKKVKWLEFHEGTLYKK